jgi:endonuclease YncB( thermonuclease family)
MRWITLLAMIVVPCAFADTISGTVVNVIDGDTLVIEDAAKRHYTIRLAEIDAPESSQPFWLQSSRALASLCHRKSAQVEWTERDAKGRYIGYVTCAGKDASAEQLKRGMARVSPKSTQPTSGLYELEGYARARGIGLWAGN